MKNFDIDYWMDGYTAKITSVFGERIRFIGIQGSQARGEANENSDIDTVLLLDRLDYADIKAYDEAVSTLPERERLCGFLSGEDELRNWERSDLFQFYHDTRPLYGSIDWIAGLLTREDVRRAVHFAACNLYHMCVHNALHGKNADDVYGMYKAAVFALQAKHYAETGEYIRKRADLAQNLTGDDREVLAYAMGKPGSFDEISEFLLNWCRNIITEFRE